MNFNAINVDGVRWGNAAIDAGAERRRAHAKHSAKGKSAEQMPWTDPFWLPVLVEEVGEVARAMCDHESAERVREELIQVAAMALAWADAVQEAIECCESCGSMGSITHYSPDHGARFCDGCYQRENPKAEAQP